MFDSAVFVLMRSPWNRERRWRGSAVDVALPAGRALGGMRETADFWRLNDSAPPIRLAFWLSPFSKFAFGRPMLGRRLRRRF